MTLPLSGTGKPSTHWLKFDFPRPGPIFEFTASTPLVGERENPNPNMWGEQENFQKSYANVIAHEKPADSVAEKSSVPDFGARGVVLNPEVAPPIFMAFLSVLYSGH
jgi:hypothetical protein